jgi:Family of unknown function (DUF6527)
MGDAGTALWIAEATGTCRLALRRFRLRDEDGRLRDPGGHFHDAMVVIDENAASTRGEDGHREVRGDRVPHDDPRWPASCLCGEPFRDDDEWQCPELDWFEGSGGRFAWGIGSWDGIPGAMIRAKWRDIDGRPPAWVVFLPNGTTWCTSDRAAADGNAVGPYWEVTGTPPLITVSPSIDDRNPGRPWHGWIRSGEMTLA